METKENVQTAGERKEMYTSREGKKKGRERMKRKDEQQ